MCAYFVHWAGDGRYIMVSMTGRIGPSRTTFHSKMKSTGFEN